MRAAAIYQEKFAMRNEAYITLDGFALIALIIYLPKLIYCVVRLYSLRESCRIPGDIGVNRLPRRHTDR